MSLLRKEDKGGGMMERLTEKQSSGFDLKSMNGEWCNKYCEQQRVQTCNECGIYQAIQKLAEYEDLEEQGLLLRLFCKIGDTIWYVDNDDDDYPIKLEIDIISIDDNKNIWYYANDDIYGKFGFIDSDFGKTVFLTQAEAEQKLKEIEND